MNILHMQHAGRVEVQSGFASHGNVSFQLTVQEIMMIALWYRYGLSDIFVCKIVFNDQFNKYNHKINVILINDKQGKEHQ